MVIAVLAVIWVVALTPMLLRKLSERRLATSVDSFHRQLGSLRRAYPRLAANATHPEMAFSMVSMSRSETRSTPDTDTDTDAPAPAERRRARLGVRLELRGVAGCCASLLAQWSVSFCWERSQACESSGTLHCWPSGLRLATWPCSSTSTGARRSVR